MTKTFTTKILRRSGTVATFFKYFTLLIFGLLAVYPFFWIALTSLKDNFELYGNPFGLPASFRIENYISAWKTAQVNIYLFNSIIVTASVVALVLLFSAMASYVLSRVWKNEILYVFFIVGIMIPLHSLLIPTFILIKNLGLMNTRLALILVYAAINISLSVFLLVGFMKTIPYEVEEAAIIDGAPRARIFFSIIFPLSKPSLATVGTLTLLGSWNEFLFANVLIATVPQRTLTQGIAALQGQYFTNYGLLCAGLMVSIIPVSIIYIIFQEQVIKGMSAGAVKG